MIPVRTFAGKTVAVLGLGLSGLAAARALCAGRARVLAWDDDEEARRRALACGIAVADLCLADLSDVCAVVASPGIALTYPEPHRIVKRARAANIEVIGDTELFFREIAAQERNAPIICITGTNGKSTTTALIGHILSQAGYDSVVGGNIGRPVLDLPEPVCGRHYVLEMSSYQIELTPSVHPDVGVLLNISPDHLERHGSMTNYAAVKARLFSRQGKADTAIVSIDDNYSASIAERAASHARMVHISVARSLSPGLYVENAVLHDVMHGKEAACVALTGIVSLRGVHNWENAAAAYATARALDLTPDAIGRALRTFPGLPHRMEEVKRRGHVVFVNDSKATNANAASYALSAFERIYWIVGGLPKAGGIESLKAFFPRIVRAYLIGKAAGDFAKSFEGRVNYIVSGTLDRAVVQATRDASADKAAEAVVLLSPACASFDQFNDFEARGAAFRNAVGTLSESPMNA
ncbi:MAG: UDP-N-acetylmuramoyl-L-alanine--D-glutamate ligase [Hyphomicrobiales bacterium]